MFHWMGDFYWHRQLSCVSGVHLTLHLFCRCSKEVVWLFLNSTWHDTLCHNSHLPNNQLIQCCTTVQLINITADSLRNSSSQHHNHVAEAVPCSCNIQLYNPAISGILVIMYSTKTSQVNSRFSCRNNVTRISDFMGVEITVSYYIAYPLQ